METKTVLIGVGAVLATAVTVLAYRKYKQSTTYTLPAGTTQQPQGVVQAAQNLISAGQNIVSQVQSLAPASNYEGKLIRVWNGSSKDYPNKGRVFFVQGNLLHYVDKLPTPDGRFNWGMVQDVPSTPDLKEGATYSELVASGRSYSSAPAQGAGPWTGINGIARDPLGRGQLSLHSALYN